MKHLFELFNGYERAGIVPCMFVLMGNFFAHPYRDGSQNIYEMKRCFDALGDLIADFPGIAAGMHYNEFLPY